MLLITGFPGFIGSHLLPRLMAQDDAREAVCLVQHTHAEQARQALAGLDTPQLRLGERVRLVEGDITRAGLALADDAWLPRVTDVWHLAGVYDTVAPRTLAEMVNVAGTANMLATAADLPQLRRFHHISTCYVSGDHPGEFDEEDLDVGQGFHSIYDETKFLAEAEVRKAMADGLPATVYRPAAVVGHSRTGWTQKFDGPYFVVDFMLRQPRRMTLLPRFADPHAAWFNIVPIDYLADAIAVLSQRDDNAGRTYQVADPAETSVAEIIDAFAAATEHRIVWVPLPLKPVRAVDRVPFVNRFVRIPAPAFDYLTSTTRYTCVNTQADLRGTGVSCPRLADYARVLVDFMRTHPEVTSAAMV